MVTLISIAESTARGRPTRGGAGARTTVRTDLSYRALYGIRARDALLAAKRAVLSHDCPAIHKNDLNVGSANPILPCRLIGCACIPAIGGVHVRKLDQHGRFQMTVALKQLERRVGSQMLGAEALKCGFGM